MTDTSNTHLASVIIIGGGVQGICLLHQLYQQNISAVLITDSSIGDGQSIINHGYFHEGYVFFSKEVHNLSAHWPADLLRRIRQPSPVYFAGPPEFLKTFSSNWDANSMSWERVQTPPQFASGKAGAMEFVRIEDFTFNKQQLIQELSKPVANQILSGRVTSCEKSNNEWKVVVNHLDSTNHPQEVVFTCSAIALCAGAANYSLAQKVARTENQETNSKEIQSVLQTWKANNVHMLCVKGPKSILPCESLLCWPLETMIVAQPCPDDEEQTVYYITYFNSIQKQLANNQNELPSDAMGDLHSPLVSAAVDAFFAILPQAAQNKEVLSWFAYSGWKVNHPLDPSNHWKLLCDRLFDGDNSALVVNPSIISNIFTCASNAIEMFSLEISGDGQFSNHNINFPLQQQHDISYLPEARYGWESFESFSGKFSVHAQL